MNSYLAGIHKFLALALIAASVCLASSVNAAPDGEVPSWHAGFLYPNGVDVAGYTLERKLDSHESLYRYYTFGIPSFAAMGVSYYENFSGNGLVASAGAGVGFVFHTSVSYQWRISANQYIKMGAGYATGVSYAGTYPALSYEYRLD